MASGTKLITNDLAKAQNDDELDEWFGSDNKEAGRSAEAELLAQVGCRPEQEAQLPTRATREDDE